MRTIIAGSRGITDAFFVVSLLDDYDRTVRPVTTVISGGARGIDFLGESWAQRTGRPVERYPADWKQYPRAAGPIRNRLMLKVAQACVVIWDGQSPGSRDMAKVAMGRIPTRLYRVAPYVASDGYMRWQIVDMREWEVRRHPGDVEQLKAIADKF